MSISVAFLLLQFFASVLLQMQLSPANPEIHYCFSTRGLRGCDSNELLPISNSTFEFGKQQSNTLTVEGKKMLYLILECKAPYPIRWLAHKPLGSLTYEPSYKTPNIQEPIQYSHWVSILLRSDFSRTLRCESISNDSLAAEVFLAADHSTERRALNTQSVKTKYFLVEKSTTAKQMVDEFIIPCVGQELYDEHVVRLAKTGKFAVFNIKRSRKSARPTIEGLWSMNFNAETAVVGGYEYKVGTDYVCRTKTPSGEVVVGKIRDVENGCFYAGGKDEFQTNSSGSYEVLLSDPSNYAWVAKSHGAIEEGAVEGGKTSFVCRSRLNPIVNGSSKGHVIPGNLVPNEGKCSIPFDGGQETMEYEILVNKSFSCNAFCKSKNITLQSKQLGTVASDQNLNISHRTSTGLWSNTFNSETTVKAGYEPGLGIAYICRATTDSGDQIVGKYYTALSWQGCYYSDGINEYEIKVASSRYQILTYDSTTTYAWMPRTNGSIADGAVEGGRTLSNELTFVCRAVYEHTTQNQTAVFLPGNLVPSMGNCSIPYWGARNIISYEVLVDVGCGNNYVYDARMGFGQKKQPDFQLKYSCYSQLGYVYQMFPISQRQKINASLYYGSKMGGQEGIYCDQEEPYQNLDLQIQVGKCDSVIECDLIFRPMPPLVGFLEDLKNEAVEFFPSYNNLTGFTFRHVSDTGYLFNSLFSLMVSRVTSMQSNHGYVHCTSLFPNSYMSNKSGYLSVTDYMFTGLDNKIYFLSQGFPNNSIISIENETQEITVGALGKFTCTISTFVLLPAVCFEIAYSGDKRPSKIVKIGDKDLEASITELPETLEKEKLTKSWQLSVVLTSDVVKITCHALWTTSSRWSSAETFLNLTSENPNPRLPTFVVIGCISALVVFFTLAVFIMILWRKYQNSKAVIRKLTEAEILEFHFGSGTEEPNQDGETLVETLGFNSDMVIKSSALKTENKVLGKGEYGIVYKGVYNHQNIEFATVAVKSCRDNADIEYFKAFLKEIKVMAFIGDHENIVKFYGAVVDKLREGKCLAVLELSPHGNLNDFLREYSGKYSTAITSSQGQPDSVQMITVGSSVLIRFCCQIASGMEFLAQKKVIHGDLAARNVLVFENNIVKITDFGLSRKLYNCANYTKTKEAPLPWRWMALESLRYFQFSTQSDVWSFGVTVWEIFSLAQVPFAGVNWTADFADQLENGFRLSKPHKASQHVFDWMMKCWENNPDARPTFTECKQFFRNLH